MDDLLQKFYDGKLAINFGNSTLEKFKILSSIINKKWVDGAKLEDHYDLFRRDDEVFIESVTKDNCGTNRTISWTYHPIADTIDIQEFIDLYSVEICIKQQDIQNILQGTAMYD